MIDPVTIAKLWLVVKPIKRLRERRQAKKAARTGDYAPESPGGEFWDWSTEGKTMQIDLGTRTSTNAIIGGGILSQVYVAAVGLIPYPPLVAALTTDQMIALVAVLIAGVVARFSKTPAVPGKL